MAADTISYYDRAAADLAVQYEAVAFEQVHAAALTVLPPPGGLVLDVGAGSGRDAAWFASQGYEVVAVEPSSGMRSEGRRMHPGNRIRWIDDRLPGLEQVHRLGLAYDLIWISAVWMHISLVDRRRAFRKLITLLQPGGRMVITLRHGPSDPERPMHPVSRAEIEALAIEHGAYIAKAEGAADQLGRSAIAWETVVVQLVDDGRGALPLIRQIILNDAKSSTYKLALLRTIARAADASSGLARIGDEVVTIPLGLVALYWVRAYLPLVATDLPQTPSSRMGEGLGFVREGFRRLAGVSPFELRVGATFLADDVASAVVGAVRDAAATIVKMPVRYTTYPGTGSQVFDGALQRAATRSGPLTINDEFLWSVGTFSVPLHLWHALTKLGQWIEPVLVSEWTRLMQRYLLSQGRTVSEGTITAALEWADPVRDTSLVRSRVREMVAGGEKISCVWTGRPLSVERMDIDHCLPFSSWPISDVWNLMPVARTVNQHQKKDKLPSTAVLAAASDQIVDWWERAYLCSEAWSQRFWKEARASLPLAGEGNLADLQAAIALKRMAIKATQQLQDWDGPA